ncbi:MAG: DUF6438 domain-containing protein [Bacteroidia bacterium]
MPWLILFFLALSLGPCNAQKKSPLASAEVFIERTACKGFCPIYRVQCNAQGEVSYYGERFVGTLGEKKLALPPEKQKALQKILTETDWHAFQDTYDNPGIADIPAVILEIRTLQGRKRILCRMNCPPELTQKIEAMERLLGSATWREGYDPEKNYPSPDEKEPPQDE